jgi:hypothetical protein
MLTIKPFYFDRQKEALHFLSPESDVRQVLYGGAASGGKTRLGCEWQILRRLTYPGTRSVIGRSQLKTLKETTLHTFFECTDRFGLKAGTHYTYNENKGLITFDNKSEIILKDLFHYPSDPNFDGLGSLEITDYFVDEVAEVSKKAVDILHSRVRYKLSEYGLTPKGLLTCNPSKSWVYDEFYLAHKENRLVDWRAYVRSLPTDNPFTEPEYLKSLLALPEYDKQRLYYGNWEFDEDQSKLFFTSDLHAMFREEQPTGDKFITADVARLGKDKSVIILWHGLRIIHVHIIERSPITAIVQHVKELRDTHGVPLKNIIADEDGIGGGVVDMLKCTGFINGSKAKHPEYMNLKSECYFKLAEYIAQGKLSADYTDGIKARFIRELETIKRHNADKDTRLQVTPKEEIKRMHGFSPDYADALMMRMYYELFPNRGNYMIMGARF